MCYVFLLVKISEPYFILDLQSNGLKITTVCRIVISSHLYQECFDASQVKLLEKDSSMNSSVAKG